jgi:integrase
MDIVKVIWKAKSKDDKLGYIRFSSRVLGKTVLRSLPLDPVEKKHFNPKNERLRTSFTKHEYYNNLIQLKLDEVNKKGNKVKFMNDDKKSFLEFMDIVIEKNITGNIGTKDKYQNLRNLVTDFNEYKYGVSDVKFSEITVDFLEELRTYMKKVRKNTNNSIFYKFKGLKSFTTKAQRDKVYNYDVNPFDLIKNTLVETTVDVLNKDDLKKMMHTPLVEVYRSGKKFGQPILDLSILNGLKYKNYKNLDDIRNFFLFQLFCQGIRVSDLLTLRWQDFYIKDEQIRIKKRMVKVKSFIDILVNYNTMDYLKNYIPWNNLPEHLVNNMSSIMYRDMANVRRTSYKSADEPRIEIDAEIIGVEIDANNIKRFNLEFKSVNELYYTSVNEVKVLLKIRNTELSKKIKKTDAVQFKQDLLSVVSADDKTSYLENLILILRSKLLDENSSTDNSTDEVKLNNYIDFAGVIEYLSNSQSKRSFVFPLLNDLDFIDIIDDDFSAMNKVQYDKFTGTRAYYNRLLKVVGSQCKINKTLTSHLSRHSFTSLMIEIGVNLNLFDLMSSLGHKNLSTTQLYISKFTGKRVDSINKEIVDFMNKV